MSLVDSAVDATVWFFDQLTLLPFGEVWVIAVIVLVSVFLLSQVLKLDRWWAMVIHSVRPHSKRDSTRAFSNTVKDTASKQCNNRCEGTGLVFRCSHEGKDLQGDHWFPWSRGGATSVDNLVMLCPKCNRKKSNKIPTRAQTFALSRRRKKHRDYTEPNSTVGQWLPRGYSSGKQSKRMRDAMKKPTF